MESGKEREKMGGEEMGRETEEREMEQETGMARPS